MGSRGYRAGHKEYMKEYFRRNPKKYLLEAAKKRAKIKNLDIDITEDDFDIPEFCPILGIKLSPVRSKDRIYSPSIDRRDNSKGYIKGNIAIISWKANKMKSDMTLAEVEALYNYLSS